MFGDGPTADLIKFVLILAGLWLLWVFTGGPADYQRVDGGPFIDPLPLESGSEIRPYRPRSGPPGSASDGGDSENSETEWPANVSPWQDQIELGPGNARYEVSPNREYVSIKNRSRDESVNVTGWQLLNNPARHQPVDAVSITAAARLFSRSAALATLGTIILPPNGEVIINTGRPPSTDIWPANVNFQTNKCLGYLAEAVSAFRLSPSLPRTCPAPDGEPGVNQLPDDCYQFVRRYPSCQTPEFTRDSEGYDRLDGRRQSLSSTCRSYLLDHFSYDRCIAWHQADADFYGDDWRIYLNRTRELWADNREVISLYDNQGKLVDQISY